MRLLAISLLSSCLAGSGCVGPVIQKPVAAHAYLSAPVPVSGGWIIDGQTRDRYNALIKLYGHAKRPSGLPYFAVPLDGDAGVTPQSNGTFFITDARMIDFGRMAGWFRQDRAPGT